jgi:hypothetical protein
MIEIGAACCANCRSRSSNGVATTEDLRIPSRDSLHRQRIALRIVNVASLEEQSRRLLAAPLDWPQQ